MITLLAIVASLAAVGFALLAWRQHRDAVRRSTARVAALTAAIDGHEPAFAAAGSLDAFGAAEPPMAGDLFVAADTRAPRRWMIAAGIVPVALIVAALVVTRGPRSAPPAPTLHHRPGARARARHGARDRRRHRARWYRPHRRQRSRSARRRRPRPRRRVVVPGGGAGRARRAPVSGAIRNAARSARAHRSPRPSRGGPCTPMTGRRTVTP